jgi:hypothetical protein
MLGGLSFTAKNLVPLIITGGLFTYVLNDYQKRKRKSSISKEVSYDIDAEYLEDLYGVDIPTIDEFTNIETNSLSKKGSFDFWPFRKPSLFESLLSNADSYVLKMILPITIVGGAAALFGYFKNKKDYENIKAESKEVEKELDEVLTNTWLLAKERQKLSKKATWQAALLPLATIASVIASPFITSKIMDWTGGYGALLRMYLLGNTIGKAQETYAAKTKEVESDEDMIESYAQIAGTRLSDVQALNKFSISLMKKLNRLAAMESSPQKNTRRTPIVKNFTPENKLESEHKLEETATKEHKSSVSLEELFNEQKI